MQDVQLSISSILRYGSMAHARSEVLTYTGSGFRRATFAEVAGRAAQLAHGLRELLGVTGDQRVGTFMWNTQEHVEAYLAIPSMGAVVHTINIRLFPDQVAYIIEHADDRVVIVDDTLVPLLSKLADRLPTVEHVVVVGDLAAADTGAFAAAGKSVLGYEELLAGQPTTFDWPEVDERDAAAMCYTSGTTGNPKGVAYSHRSVYLHSLEVCSPTGFTLDAAERTLEIVPMFHAMAWGLPYGCFLSGAAMVMPGRFLQAAPLITMIREAGVTFAGAVPTIWADVLAQLDRTGGVVPTLRRAVVGGSACPPAMIAAFDERYGVQIIHAWGMTELSPLGSVAHPPAGSEGEQRFRYRCSQGRFPALVQARLIGADGEQLPHDGEAVGELEVRGPWVTASYYRDDDPEKFRDGWLRTGDVGTITPDGYLNLTDREKDVIKSGGEWISSVELENHLMAHPAIAEATVVGVPDERWSERPLAAVVWREDPVPFEQLCAFLSGRIAKWQLPERWTALDAVPKTSVGKFDKKEVRRRYAKGDYEVTQLD
nr:long-chain fatty acid--CoA ligase [Actinocrinis puniceicyclus]